MEGSMIKRNFKNTVEASFYDYLGSQGYKESTAYHYVTRCRRVKPLDVLVNENLDVYIADYESGANCDINKASHAAYSNALKHLKNYQIL